MDAGRTRVKTITASQRVFSEQNPPTFIPTLEITKLNPYVLTKSGLSTDVGKDGGGGITGGRNA